MIDTFAAWEALCKSDELMDLKKQKRKKKLFVMLRISVSVFCLNYVLAKLACVFVLLEIISAY